MSSAARTITGVTNFPARNAVGTRLQRIERSDFGQVADAGENSLSFGKLPSEVDRFVAPNY